MRFVFIFFLFYSSMLFAECNKLYDYGFWNPDVQISDIENELENVDLNVLCGEDGKLIPLIPASLLSTKANVEFLISKGADVTLASAESIFPVPRTINPFSVCQLLLSSKSADSLL